MPLNSQCTLLGPYVVPAYNSRFTAVFTTLPIVTPYRGAGRQHGVFLIERLLDIAARELALDRAETRRRNFIAPDAFPYDNRIIYQDFAPLRITTSGDYAPVLDKAFDAIGYRTFVVDEQPRLRAIGKRVGIGVAFYVEGTGIGPYEGATIQVQGSGRVLLATGIGTQGQGHFTSFAQIVADQRSLARRRETAWLGTTHCPRQRTRQIISSPISEPCSLPAAVASAARACPRIRRRSRCGRKTVPGASMTPSRCEASARASESSIWGKRAQTNMPSPGSAEQFQSDLLEGAYDIEPRLASDVQWWRHKRRHGMSRIGISARWTS